MQRHLFLDLQVLNTYRGPAIIKGKKIKGIDLVDCCLFAYVKELCGSHSHKVALKRVDGYTWVDYKHLVKALPLLGVNERMVGARLNRMALRGLFEKKRQKDKIYRWRSYFRISQGYDNRVQMLDRKADKDKTHYTAV